MMWPNFERHLKMSSRYMYRPHHYLCRLYKRLSSQNCEWNVTITGIFENSTACPNKKVWIKALITHWEKLLDSDWLRHCEFIRNLRANSVIRGKLQISRAKSVIQIQKKLTANN